MWKTPIFEVPLGPLFNINILFLVFENESRHQEELLNLKNFKIGEYLVEIETFEN